MRMLLLLLSLLPLSSHAESAADKGLAIARESDTRDNGYGDSTASMRMLLKNKQGGESTREIRIRTLEMPQDGDRSLSIFDTPEDVKGTALLTFTHKTDADDQWLYLPALKRVKRIASENKSGPFMGSEFAYEDIASQEVEKYTYKYLRDERFDDQDCFVIERYPADKNSGYTRQVVWIDKAEYRPLKIEFFDRKDAPLKILSLKNYRQYLDKYWRAEEMAMENHQTGKSTRLIWTDYHFRTGLTERDFDRNSLQRAR